MYSSSYAYVGDGTDIGKWIEGAEEWDAPETPKKKRKVQSVSTPKSRSAAKKNLKFMTPTHKR
jgi:hypothetical protein